AILKRKNGSPINVLENITAETQHGHVNQQLQQLMQDYAIVQLQLKLLLNTVTDFIPSQDNFKIQLTALADTSAINGHPYIKQLQQQQAVNMAKLKLEKSKLSPDLFAAYNNTTMKGFGADDKYYSISKRFQSVQAGVGIPLFAGAQKNSIKAMNINLQVTENNYAAGLQSLQSKYEQALLQYKKNTTFVNYYESKALKNAETIIQTANEQFLNGDINYLEWVLLTNQAIAIQNEYIDAVKNLNNTIIEINFYFNQ
ncbi:MAG: TolC family protein, partial [Panacibacter sp.]